MSVKCKPVFINNYKIIIFALRLRCDCFVSATQLVKGNPV